MDLPKYILVSLTIALTGLSGVASAQTFQSCADTVAEKRQAEERRLVEKLHRLAGARLDAEAIQARAAADAGKADRDKSKRS